MNTENHQCLCRGEARAVSREGCTGIEHEGVVEKWNGDACAGEICMWMPGGIESTQLRG